MSPWTSALRKTANLCAALCLVVCTSAARADGGADGVYRRWDHDAILVLGVGGGLTRHGGQTFGTTAASLRLRIADAAGPVVALRWGPSAGGYLFAGIELRPLWPALFLIDKATHYEWLDLFIQSFNVEIGAAVLPLGAPVGAPPVDGVGAAFAVGFGMELPLGLPSKMRGHWHGLALRLAARRVWSPPRFQGARPEADLSEWSALCTLLVRIGVGIRTSAWEPARYRY